MAFTMAKVDEDILQKVDIRIIGPSDANAITDEPTQAGVRLNSNNLQFPPKINKDGKQAEWMEVPSGSYEPMKYYVQSHARAIGIKFEWICGGRFPPDKVHKIVSAIKSYFYGPYFAVNKNRQDYPIVEIFNFYGIIDKRSTWRMMDMSVNYSDEICKINNIFYPIHVEVTINLESATQLGHLSGASGDVDTPYKYFDNLEVSPDFTWY